MLLEMQLSMLLEMQPFEMQRKKDRPRVRYGFVNHFFSLLLQNKAKK